jgi:hypothetical protein
MTMIPFPSPESPTTHGDYEELRELCFRLLRLLIELNTKVDKITEILEDSK